MYWEWSNDRFLEHETWLDNVMMRFGCVVPSQIICFLLVLLASDWFVWHTRGALESLSYVQGRNLKVLKKLGGVL